MPRPSRSRTHAASAAVSRSVARGSSAKSNVWVLVADAARARLFEYAAGGKKLREIACFDNPESRVHAVARDRLPRSNESVGRARHAIEPHTTMREKSTERFARCLCDELESGRALQRYDQLVLVAPARFRGTLRRHLGEPLLSCISAEISRDLTTWPVERILEHLTAPLAT